MASQPRAHCCKVNKHHQCVNTRAPPALRSESISVVAVRCWVTVTRGWGAGKEEKTVWETNQREKLRKYAAICILSRLSRSADGLVLACTVDAAVHTQNVSGSHDKLVLGMLVQLQRVYAAWSQNTEARCHIGTDLWTCCVACTSMSALPTELGPRNRFSEHGSCACCQSAEM
ncbi:hypothetical protein C8R47DRAFT_1095612, partial [Mycena vitilis]